MANPFIAHPLLMIFKKHANLLADPPPPKKGATKNDEIFSMPSFYYWPWRTCSQMLKMVHPHLKLERENLKKKHLPLQGTIIVSFWVDDFPFNQRWVHWWVWYKSPQNLLYQLLQIYPRPPGLEISQNQLVGSQTDLFWKRNRLSYTFIPKNPDSIFSLRKTGPKLRHATGLTFKAAFPWTKGGYRARPGAKSALVWKFPPFLEPRWHTSFRNVGGKKHTGGNPLSFMIGLIYIHLTYILYSNFWSTLGLVKHKSKVSTQMSLL